MENKKDTIWITISEDKAPATSLPIEDSHESTVVKNKVFWGAGFVALMIFTSMLFAPAQFAQLMQGQLFDGGFQVIPDFDEQPANEFFEGVKGDDTKTSDVSTTTTEQSASKTTVKTTPTKDINVVGAAADAVSIEITPLADTDKAVTDQQTADTKPVTDSTDSTSQTTTASTTAASTTTTSTTSTSVSEDAGTGVSVVSSDSTTTVSDTVTSADTHAAAPANGGDVAKDTDTSIPAGVQAELDSLKKMQEDSQALITQLTQLLQSQGGLYGAGTTQVSPSLLPGGQAQQFGNQQFGQNQNAQNAGTYRYNTHTVTISPYEVLKMNQGIQAQVAQSQQSYQANIQYGGTIPYNNTNYNSALAGVNGQPATGPADALMIALLLASIGVLVWGSVRAARA